LTPLTHFSQVDAKELRRLCETMSDLWEKYGDAHITSYVEMMRDHAADVWEEWGCFSKASSRPVETAHRRREQILLYGTNGKVEKAKGIGKYGRSMLKVAQIHLPVFEGRQQECYSVRSKAAPGSKFGVVHPRARARHKSEAKHRYAPYPEVPIKTLRGKEKYQ
jgi:hypothetical protein